MLQQRQLGFQVWSWEAWLAAYLQVHYNVSCAAPVRICVYVCVSVHVCMYTIPFQLPSVCLSIHACWYTMTLHFLFVYLAESVSMSTLVSLLPWLCLCASVYISSLFMLLSVIPHILSAAGAISDYVIRKYSNSPSVGLRVKVRRRPLVESLLAAGHVYSLWQDIST